MATGLAQCDQPGSHERPIDGFTDSAEGRVNTHSSVTLQCVCALSMDLRIQDRGDVHKAISPVLLYVTECVLSCQREVEDEMDSYQVSTQSTNTSCCNVGSNLGMMGGLLYSRDPRQWHDLVCGG